MKIIEPSVELWQQGYDIHSIWKHIAKCCRCCYQSTPRNNGETDEEFVQRVIFRNRDYKTIGKSRLEQLKLHLSVLEHGAVYLKVPHNIRYKFDMNFFHKNQYSRASYHLEDEHYYITTNMRVLVENNLTYYLRYLTTPEYDDRLTFSIITDIGVARELARHRKHSISEESTRYVNYSKDKFGSELIFIQPNWSLDSFAGELFKKSCQEAENNYMKLINNGWAAQKAREALPLCTKVQTIHTAYLSDWEEFIKLRGDAISGSVHPNMLAVADKIKEILKTKTIRK